MSLAAILGLVYGVGAFIGLVYAGAAGLEWGDGYGGPGRAWLFLLWPIGAPVVLGKAMRIVADRAAERRRLAAEEKRKWLEAPLP